MRIHYNKKKQLSIRLLIEILKQPANVSDVKKSGHVNLFFSPFMLLCIPLIVVTTAEKKKKKSSTSLHLSKNLKQKVQLTLFTHEGDSWSGRGCHQSLELHTLSRYQQTQLEKPFVFSFIYHTRKENCGAREKCSLKSGAAVWFIYLWLFDVVAEPDSAWRRVSSRFSE